MREVWIPMLRRTTEDKSDVTSFIAANATQKDRDKSRDYCSSSHQRMLPHHCHYFCFTIWKQRKRKLQRSLRLPFGWRMEDGNRKEKVGENGVYLSRAFMTSPAC